MSDTPRTDASVWHHHNAGSIVTPNFARTLERELNDAIYDYNKRNIECDVYLAEVERLRAHNATLRKGLLIIRDDIPYVVVEARRVAINTLDA